MKDHYNFSNAVRNPFYGKFIKDGKCTIIEESEDYDEVILYDIKTDTRTVLEVIPRERAVWYDLEEDDSMPDESAILEEHRASK